MADEYYRRYRGQTHDQLYRQLMRGAPAAVSTQADTWRATAGTTSALSARLRRDVARLAARWSGLGSDEFVGRIGLIVTYAQKLADEAASVGVGVEAMGRALAEAQRQASPDPVGSDPLAVRAALRGAATNVLGSSLGHTPPPEEQAAARERMVTLVAELAALYGLVDQANWPAELPSAPAGMPGSVVAADPGPAAVVPVEEQSGPDAGLAGAGPMTTGPTGPVGVSAGPMPGGPIGAVPPAPPPAMLAGAGPGPASATTRSVGATAGPAASNAAPAAPAPGAVPMAPGGVIGQQPGGGPRFEDGSDWWAGAGAAWVTPNAGGAEPPEAVVGA